MDERTAARHSRNQKPLLVLSCAGAILAGALGWWWSVLNAPVNFTAPMQKMPSPNGFDFFVAAGKALIDVEKIQIAYWGPSGALQAGARRLTWPEKEALVGDNAAALSLIREGFLHECLSPPRRSLTAPFPDQEPAFRALYLLLSVEGQLYAHRDEWGPAMDCYVDACDLGSRTQRGAAVGRLDVNLLCERSGRSHAWGIADRLDAARARRTARRLQRIMENTVPYADNLREEKWLVAAGYTELLNKPGWRSAIANMRSSENEATNLVTRLQLSTLSRRRVIEDYLAYMDQRIEEAKRPYPARGPWPQPPGDPINEMMVEPFEKRGFGSEVNRTMDGLLCVSLALWAYDLEHGSYPATLKALVPGYISRLPDDPFGMHGTFGYRPKASRYVLYSLGPDSRDDSGTPAMPSFRHSSHDPAVRCLVDPNSKGDIVAGVNRM